ncbi:MAG: hypothetical protein ACD_44C00118G0001 [uncultured bacterium]|nr:MAG: hypothetical protein ACD_44C00118G0001 [uncultured bacterium]
MSTDFILFKETQFMGEVILNRPKVYNALNHDMILALYQKLRVWEKAPHIKLILISSSSDKAFCAGGDIKAVYEKGMAHHEELHQFFQSEYRLNHLIYHYPKPYIAFLDGITMGGGAGISIHGSHRIATENFSFAMPETAIGFYPDVGSSYFLSRCIDKTGLYLGLAGARIHAAQTCFLKLTDYFFKNISFEKIRSTLLSLESFSNHSIRECLLPFHHEEKLTDFPLEAIQRCFNASSVEEIFENLKTENTVWAKVTLKNLEKSSPLSLKTTFEQLQKAKNLDFSNCLKMESTLTKNFLKDPNFYEGIRALLIDKDQLPKWEPNTLALVSEKKINHFFCF